MTYTFFFFFLSQNTVYVPSLQLFSSFALIVCDLLYLFVSIKYCHSKINSSKDEQKRCIFFSLCFLATLPIDLLTLTKWWFRLYLCTKFWSFYALLISLTQNHSSMNLILSKIPVFDVGQYNGLESLTSLSVTSWFSF